MPKAYDPILCMMVDEPTKARDELSLAQKKQVVVELKGYLKKSYNFSDESEYARAYEDLRRMFTTGSRKSISGLFENTVKKTGAHDSASYPAEVYKMQNEVARVKKIDKNHISIRKLSNDKYEFSNRLGDPLAVYNDKAGTLMMYDSKSALDKAIRAVDGVTGDKLYADVKAIYNLFSNILRTYSNEQSVQKLANEGTNKCLELAAKVKGVRDEAIRVHDAKKLELGTDERQNVRKAIQLLKNAASLVNNVAMDVDNRRLGGVVNNIQNDISILEDML